MPQSFAAINLHLVFSTKNRAFLTRDKHALDAPCNRLIVSRVYLVAAVPCAASQALTGSF